MPKSMSVPANARAIVPIIIIEISRLHPVMLPAYRIRETENVLCHSAGKVIITELGTVFYNRGIAGENGADVVRCSKRLIGCWKNKSKRSRRGGIIVANRKIGQVGLNLIK